MQVRIYWIDDFESGRLGIMPRPRGGDWLEDEIRSLKVSGVDAVVSLLERVKFAIDRRLTAEIGLHARKLEQREGAVRLPSVRRINRVADCARAR